MKKYGKASGIHRLEKYSGIFWVFNLVGGFNPLKNMSSSVGIILPN
jgi:hypothetical protein